jgi:hypothetical protein
LTDAQWNRAVLVVVLSLLALPVLVDLFVSGRGAAVRYSASDTFYYHTVARNLALNGIASFDQTYPTNGFHPLWQVTLAGLYGASHAAGVSDGGYLRLSILLSLAFVALGFYFLWRSLVIMRGRVPAVFALFPTGVYALLLAPAWAVAIYAVGARNVFEGPLPLYGTMWSFVNGMESAPVLLSFGLVALTFSRGQYLLLGLACSLLTLSRLDHVFIAGTFAMYAAWHTHVGGGSSRALFVLAAFGLPIGMYLGVNLWYMDAVMPLSGAAKSSFPFPSMGHLPAIASLLSHPSRLFTNLDTVYRLTQILIPLGAALAFLKWSQKAPKTRWRQFLTCAAIGTALLSLYTFLFVAPLGQGHWYFPVGIVFVTLAVGEALGLRWRSPRALTAMAALSLVVFVTLHRRPSYHEDYSSFFFDAAPLLKEAYLQAPPKVVEADDGILAFATGFESLSGSLLALDKAAFEASKQGRLAELAYARGFNTIATVVYDANREAPTLQSTPDQVRQYIASLFSLIGNADDYDFTVEYRSPITDFVLIRFEPKERPGERG